MANESKPQKIELSQAVAYQSGAVVSKEIIKKATGTVTLFAFDKGQGLSEHTAPFDALVQVIDGEAEIIISGTNYHLKAGEVIIMPGISRTRLTRKKNLK